MEHTNSAESLSHRDLIARFARLLAHERKATAELLRTMAAIDRRRLWAEEGYPSFFAFCVERYRMSEAMANKRIRAARAARQFPVIFRMIASGEIHLTGVGQLAKHLTEENHQEVLARAKHKTMREIDELVAELAPQPDRASRLALAPQPHGCGGTAAPIECDDRARAEKVAASNTTLERAEAREGEGGVSVGGGEVTAGRSDDEPVGQASEARESGTTALRAVGRGTRAPDPQPIAPRRYRLSVTLSQEGHDRLRELQGVLGHQVPDGDPAAIVEKALEVLLAQALKTKAAQTERPRKSAESEPAESDSAGNTRSIPAAVRREVWQRDEGRCAFISASGHRCGSQRLVEFHHVRPFAKGGGHGVDNIELHCRAHNALHAEQDYGHRFMESKRNPPRVREHRAAYRARTPPARTAQAWDSRICGEMLVDARGFADSKVVGAGFGGSLGATSLPTLLRRCSRSLLRRGLTKC